MIDTVILTEFKFENGVVYTIVNDIGLAINVGDINFLSIKGLLYTHLVFNELTGFKLYGFVTPEERELFLNLLKVSGVGAKQALNITSNIKADAFITYIKNNDHKQLEKIKGIGSKTALKIVKKLKNAYR